MRVACAARATTEQPLPIPGTIDDTVRQIEAAGGTAIAVPTNLSRDEEVVAMIETTIAAFGRVDILVNNAAITFPGDIELPMKRFDLVFAVDLRAPVLAAQAVVPGMIERGEGAIVNVSSAAALNYYPGQMAYGMAKSALEHFTVSLGSQLRPHHITVNTFRIDVPVASEGFLAAMPDDDHSDWEPPEVAAEGIVWLLGQELHRPEPRDGPAPRRARDHGIPRPAPAHPEPGDGHRLRARLTPPLNLPPLTDPLRSRPAGGGPRSRRATRRARARPAR